GIGEWNPFDNESRVFFGVVAMRCGWSCSPVCQFILFKYLCFGKNRLGRRKRVAGKRPPYGVKTGLAARKALGSHKGISPLNRSPLSEKVCVSLQSITSPLKPRLTSTPVPPFLLKKDQSEEKKIPKGVPLQFDINSVGKQTNMTLNERFGILKEQRTALSQNKGSRFVTVG
uniref:UAP56-interacting factor n=1 Tax=Podarcis muralis TaxID=64176 RepID=A0A670I8N4_PODMU